MVGQEEELKVIAEEVVDGACLDVVPSTGHCRRVATGEVVASGADPLVSSTHCTLGSPIAAHDAQSPTSFSVGPLLSHLHGLKPDWPMASVQ